MGNYFLASLDSRSKNVGVFTAIVAEIDLALLWQILRGNEALGIPESGFQ